MFKLSNFIIILVFFTVKYSIADNSRVVLNEILPGILLYSAKNEEANNINQGAIANKIAILGKEYILVFDTGPSKIFAEKFIKEVRKFSNNPIKYLVISHRHFDHAFGIEAYIQEKAIILMDETEFAYLKKEGPKINKLLIENLKLDKNNINFDKISKKYIQFVNDKIEVDLGNRKVLIKNLGEAHTKGDLVSYDYNTKTYLTGDIIFQGRAATFSDADVPKWIYGIEKKLDKPWTLLIPGHGKVIQNQEGLSDTKSWLNFLDKSIKRSITQGDTIAEIFHYAIPENIKHLKMKRITLRQGIKKQIYLYRKKYIE